ncbi:hypothetical protein AB9F36_11665 [Rhizobium leguminosarum]|uniref:hypothetical protein n=1 Tax=Rhizobium leguminosarum TaxID=384 RepID=UPI003F99E48A
MSKSVSAVVGFGLAFLSSFAAEAAQDLDGKTMSTVVISSTDVPDLGGTYDENITSNQVTYNSSLAGNTLSIYPNSEYLQKVYNGNSVNGIHYYWVPFDWVIPELSIKLNNSMDHDVTFSRLNVHVSDSTVDIRPVPVFYWGSVESLSLKNEGWGPMRSAKLALGFAKSSKCDGPQTVMADSIAGKFETTVGDINEYYRLDLADLLPIDLRGEPDVCAVGLLRFSDSDGNDHALRFRTLVLLGFPGVGAPGPPTANYSLYLEPGKSNYDIQIPISQVVPAKSYDNFTVSIYSKKSAAFKFNIQVVSTDGKVATERNIHLTYFVPRSMRVLDPPKSLFSDFNIDPEDNERLKRYVTSIKQNPVNPEELTFDITEDWILLPLKKRTEIHKLLITALAKKGTLSGRFCYANAEDRCLRSGEF